MPNSINSKSSITQNYINSLLKQIDILTAEKNDLQERLNAEREYNKQQSDRIAIQSDRIADLADKLTELTRNSQVLLKQEQDKTAYLLPDESQGSTEINGEGEGKKRGFWRFWKK